MNDFSERLLADTPRKSREARFRVITLILVPLVAILFTGYVPRFLHALSYLELPLLVTMHFALNRREPVPAVLYGAAIGITQDALTDHPIGLLGIVKTLVGYFAASVSQRFDVSNPVLTFILGFFFYIFHQFFLWVLTRALLGASVNFDVQQTLIFGLLNAAVAIPLFHLLDKLKVTA